MSAAERRRFVKVSGRLNKAARKQQLLGHAKQLFVANGYHNTTTEKIAQAAGITEPVLYRHFESKKALFLAVLREIREATLERWRTETADLPDPLAKLHAISDMYLGSMKAHAVEFRIMHRTLIESNDDEIAAFLRDSTSTAKACSPRSSAKGSRRASSAATSTHASAPGS